MKIRNIIIVLMIFLSFRSYVLAEQKQYIQVMHENKYQKQSDTVKTKSVPAKSQQGLNNEECNRYINEALKQIDQNNLFGAQTSLTRALDINPNSVKALKIRGQVKNRLGDNVRALQDLNKAISLKPDGDCYYARGVVKLSTQNYPEAVNDFSKAIEENKSDDMAYHQRGYSYCLWGKSTGNNSYFAAALYDFNKSISLNPSNTESYLYRGMAKAELKGASAGLADIEYAMNEYQRIGDSSAYQRSVEIYNWIKKDY